MHLRRLSIETIASGNGLDVHLLQARINITTVNREQIKSRVHFRPAHDTATDTEWQLPEVVLTQFVSPDDEHDVLETCRELKMQINT